MGVCQLERFRKIGFLKVPTAVNRSFGLYAHRMLRKTIHNQTSIPKRIGKPGSAVHILHSYFNDSR